MSAEVLRQHIHEAGILDPEGVHHGFAGGMHGRKLDFDSIPDYSPLFWEWVDVAAEAISTTYSVREYGELVVLSVANGTNRLVPHIVECLGTHATALLTKKISPKAVRLTDESRKAIQSIDPDLVVALEDVGTAGTTSATAVVSAREAGARKVVVMNTWQRRQRLERLEEISADYTSIINELLPTFAPDECRRVGYCAVGWEYIEHGQ